jgi:hypothetical protein
MLVAKKDRLNSEYNYMTAANVWGNLATQKQWADGEFAIKENVTINNYKSFASLTINGILIAFVKFTNNTFVFIALRSGLEIIKLHNRHEIHGWTKDQNETFFKKVYNIVFGPAKVNVMDEAERWTTIMGSNSLILPYDNEEYYFNVKIFKLNENVDETMLIPQQLIKLGFEELDITNKINYTGNITEDQKYHKIIEFIKCRFKFNDYYNSKIYENMNHAEQKTLFDETYPIGNRKLHDITMFNYMNEQPLSFLSICTFFEVKETNVINLFYKKYNAKADLLFDEFKNTFKLKDFVPLTAWVQTNLYNATKYLYIDYGRNVGNLDKAFLALLSYMLVCSNTGLFLLLNFIDNYKIRMENEIIIDPIDYNILNYNINRMYNTYYSDPNQLIDYDKDTTRFKCPQLGSKVIQTTSMNQSDVKNNNLINSNIIQQADINSISCHYLKPSKLEEKKFDNKDIIFNKGMHDIYLDKQILEQNVYRNTFTHNQSKKQLNALELTDKQINDMYAEDSNYQLNITKDDLKRIKDKNLGEKEIRDKKMAAIFQNQKQEAQQAQIARLRDEPPIILNNIIEEEEFNPHNPNYVG